SQTLSEAGATSPQMSRTRSLRSHRTTRGPIRRRSHVSSRRSSSATSTSRTSLWPTRLQSCKLWRALAASPSRSSHLCSRLGKSQYEIKRLDEIGRFVLNERGSPRSGDSRLRDNRLGESQHQKDAASEIRCRSRCDPAGDRAGGRSLAQLL